MGLSNQFKRYFIFRPFGSGLASVTKRKLDHVIIDFDQEEDINLLRFDKYWEKEELIDYVRIDVEGHELDVLKGLELIYKTNLIQLNLEVVILIREHFFRILVFLFKKEFIIYRITLKVAT